jgi:hypothetical protein
MGWSTSASAWNNSTSIGITASGGTYTAVCMGSTATVTAGTQPGTVFRVKRKFSGAYLFSVNGGAQTQLTCTYPFYNLVNATTGSWTFRMFAYQVDDWFGGAF